MPSRPSLPPQPPGRLSPKITVVQNADGTIRSVHPCLAAMPSSRPKRVKLFVFNRPEEGGNKIGNDAIRTGYKIQAGNLVKI